MMKNKRMAQSLRGYGLTFLLVTGMFFTAGRVQAAADSVQLNFKYTVVQGTCTVGVSPASVVLPDIPLPAKMPTDYSGYTADGPKKGFPFDVNLTQCSGASGTKKPRLRLTGNHDLPAGTTTALDKSVLFRDSSSLSEGVGFVIYQSTTPVVGSSGNFVCDYNAPCSNSARNTITIPGVPGNTLISDTTVHMSANVSRGNQTGPLKAGTLTATVYFEFDYN
ncbi:fimbrial protein [Lelliottia aquatilis]|uniref:fimbrial protein n=1 Tax=Lelliottia aquatilis TaxID=2080838 RepID=UPI00157758F9|nr:fimbrial protein [Lelliottia aquatilis]